MVIDAYPDTQATEELEIDCPQNGPAVVDLRYHAGLGELEVVRCSICGEPVRCSQACIRN